MAYTTIKKPSDYFNTKLYTGNGTTDTAQTGVGFQPDWTIIKARSIGYNNNVFDAVRGSTKRIMTDVTNAESTQAEMVKSFDSDGFTLGNDAGVNANTETFVAWNWKANGAGSANTDGSINTTSTSVNTTAGFSISKFTGTGANATVGHGLGVAPSMIIVKNLSISSQWWVYHASLGATKSLNLNATDAEQTVSVIWNNTAPTSSVFSVGTGNEVNGSGNSMIAYCFAEKTGYSKFGSYTGNGNADGTFVYTGFKPAFVMWKNTTTASTNWHIVDDKRDTFNIVDKLLLPNDSSAEITQSALDLTSNGFKIRVTNGFVNTSGDNYIYMAFADEPLVGDNPATAR